MYMLPVSPASNIHFVSLSTGRFQVIGHSETEEVAFCMSLGIIFSENSNVR